MLTVGAFRFAAHSLVGASKLISTPDPFTASRRTSLRSESSTSWITGTRLAPLRTGRQRWTGGRRGQLVCPIGQSLDQALPHRVCHGLRAITELQPRGHVVDHVLDRSLRIRQIVGDLSGVQSVRNEAEDVDLAL